MKTGYLVQLSRRADKFLQSADDIDHFKESIRNMIEYLEGAETATQPDMKKLKGRFKGSFRLRTGKFRIVFRISDKSIFIMDIQSRGQVYKG